MIRSRSLAGPANRSRRSLRIIPCEIFHSLDVNVFAARHHRPR